MQAEGSFWKVLWDMLGDIKAVARGDERHAFRTALWLAFFNQAMASSAIVNYAPRLLQDSGIHSETVATLLTSSVTAAKVHSPYTSRRKLSQSCKDLSYRTALASAWCPGTHVTSHVPFHCSAPELQRSSILLLTFQ